MPTKQQILKKMIDLAVPAAVLAKQVGAVAPTFFDTGEDWQRDYPGMRAKTVEWLGILTGAELAKISIILHLDE